MARKLDDMMAALPPDRLQRIDARAMELATLKDLRQAAQQTQEQLQGLRRRLHLRAQPTEEPVQGLRRRLHLRAQQTQEQMQDM
jgi:hypothetical protein